MKTKYSPLVIFVIVVLLVGTAITAGTPMVRESKAEEEAQKQIAGPLAETGEYVRSNKSGMLDGAESAVIEMDVWIHSQFMSEDEYGHLGGIASGTGSTSDPDIEFGFRKNHRESGPNTLDVVINLGDEGDNNHHFSTIFEEGDHDNEWITLRAEYEAGELEVFVNGKSYNTSYPEGGTFGTDQDYHFYLSNPNSENYSGERSFIGRIARAELMVDGEKAVDWPIKKGNGEKVYDVSGNENHGLIVGPEWKEENVSSGYSLRFMRNYDIRILRPIISVPKIQERGKEIKIWVRNSLAIENTTWEAALYKEYSDNYTEEYDMEIIDVEKAKDKRGDNNWYLTAVVPEDAREELYDLKVTDGNKSVKSIQSVDVVDEVDDRFNFVHVTDNHLGYVENGEPVALERTKQFVKEMNLIQPDFVMHTGDACDKEPDIYADQNPDQKDQDERFYELMQELEVPMYVIPGNHDYSYTSLTGDPSSETSIQSYKKWINPHLNYTFTYGEDYHFVMQNSGRPAFPFETQFDPTNHDGLMSMENVTWMEEVLSENRNKTMQIVAQHAPAYPDALHYDDVRDAFREAVVDHNVTSVFAGHIHSSPIYNASGEEIPGNATDGKRPLHVATGDLSKSAHEYRLVRINGEEIESLTYDKNGDGYRDDTAAIPLEEISLDYTPENNGNNTEVVATIENDLYEHFDDAVVRFNVESPNQGERYFVENATPFERIDTGEKRLIYARTDIDRNSTKNVTVRKQRFIETLPASSFDLRSADIRGRIPDLGKTAETFFKYREYGEETWVKTSPKSKKGPQNFTVNLTGLDPLQKYEFKAGIEMHWQGNIIKEFGDTLVFVPAELSRTTQLRRGWNSSHEIDGLEVRDDSLVLEPIVNSSSSTVLVTNDGGENMDIKYNNATQEGHRISDPLPLEGIVSAGENLIGWNSTEPTGTNVTVYTAVTGDNETVPTNWTRADNGEEIESIEKGENLTDMYLWTKQILTSNGTDVSPALHDISEAVTNADPSFFEVFDVEAENIAEGEDLEVTATVENTGNFSGTQTINMTSDLGNDSKEIQLNGSQSKALTFTTETSAGDVGHYTAVVSSEDDHGQDEFEVLSKHDLTISSTEGGEVLEPGEGAFEYTDGEVVDLKAVAEPGYYFIGWTGDTAEISDVQSNETTIEVSEDYTIQANFEEYGELIIGEIQGDGVVEVEETEIGASDLPYQKEYKQGVEVNLTAEPDEGFHFVEWTGDVPSGEEESESVTITMDADKELEAKFAVNEYELVISIEGEGSTDPSEGTHVYEHGEEVTVEASAAESWYFSKWTGDYEGEQENQTVTITMAEDKELGAKFAVNEYELVISIEGEGNTTPSEGTHIYEHGEEVTVEATAGEGWNFVEWTGDHESTEEEITVTIEEDMEITARFEEEIMKYDLTVDTDGSGTIEVEPDQEEYEEGIEVTLTATPEEDWYFVGWSGDYDGTEEEITITIDKNKTIIAQFEEYQPYFEIEILNYEEKVRSDEEVTIRYEVINTGEAEGTQEGMTFSIDNKSWVDDDLTFTLEPGENYTGEFTWKPEGSGTYLIEISTDDMSESATVEVEEETDSFCHYWWMIVVLAVVVGIALIVWVRREEDKSEEPDVPPPTTLSDGDSKSEKTEEESEEYNWDKDEGEEDDYRDDEDDMEDDQSEEEALEEETVEKEKGIEEKEEVDEVEDEELDREIEPESAD